MSRLKLALLVEDTHVPYEHKKAYKLMIMVARDHFVHEIVLKGDFLDFYCVSKYGKDPRITGHLMDEVAAGNVKLDELDNFFPTAKKVYVEGNHENRLEKYIFEKAPALFGTTEIRTLLKLNQRPNWSFIPYGPNQLYRVLGSNLHVKHVPGANSAKAAASRAICSVSYGHIHRSEHSYVVGLDGEQHVAYCAGWLGDKKNDLVFGFVNGHHQWTLGFSFVYVNEETNQFYQQIIPILEKDGVVSCVVNGKLYSL